MNAQREAAYERFKAAGFPSKKVERYKYTDISQLMAPDYGLNLNRLNIPVDPYQAFRCDVPNLSTQLYFMVNDAFYGPASLPGGTGGLLPQLPDGVIVGSLNQLSKDSGSSTSEAAEPSVWSQVSAAFNSLASKSADAITDLNTMLAQDGLLVYVPRGVVVEKAIQVINILKAPFASSAPSSPPHEGAWGGAALMVNRRVLIIAEEGAEVTLLFCDHTADDCHFLTTQVIEVFARDNARVNLYCLEETHARNVRLSNVYVDQQRNSCVCHNAITLHNGITRNRLDLDLRGEGAECMCLGCVIADKQQHVDNNTLITHHACHRRLRRSGPCATRSPADRFADDQPEPVCLARGPHVHPAHA